MIKIYIIIGAAFLFAMFIQEIRIIDLKRSEKVLQDKADHEREKRIHAERELAQAQKILSDQNAAIQELNELMRTSKLAYELTKKKDEQEKLLLKTQLKGRLENSGCESQIRMIEELLKDYLIQGAL